MSTYITAGLALAAIGFGGRAILRRSRGLTEMLNKSLPTSGSFTNSKYYKGGFESKMSRREAGLVLGISPSATKTKIKEAHKRIMLLNHPDKGGSPYLAAKINEAKDLLESNRSVK
ncbi:mitochondrial import inner membrane translocase subunit TIM14-like [Oppia nitens]|uniref:mitochondrial import inner membrane translocase subunit TIM14-like n=1 Tax=Oppia nitens TaxID=1686743 RepID=UPI0023DA57E3|nr:mitochondrial import inner membrane translocase subunit TIM14-like [Oppia nitens]